MSILNIPVLLSVAYYLTTAWAVTISENTVVKSPVSLDIGELNINEGVYYSIVDNALTALGGNLNNKGGFYVTSENGLAASVTAVSGTIINSGDLAFNSLKANVISNYNMDSIGTFSNSGNMWIGTSVFSAVPPIILGSALDWKNTGKIYVRQREGRASPITISQALGSITNDGTICVERYNWVQTTTIDGKGCVNIKEDGHLQLQLSPWSVDKEQTLYLSSPSSSLSVLGLEPSLLGTKSFNVIGFGGGNKINVNLGFTDYSYKDGKLTLSFFLGAFKIDFNIGEGYDTSKFKTNGPGKAGTSISYDGQWSGQAPDVCQCKDFPVPPTEETSSSSSSSSSASSSSSSSPGESSSSSPTSSEPSSSSEAETSPSASSSSSTPGQSSPTPGPSSTPEQSSSTSSDSSAPGESTPAPSQTTSDPGSSSEPNFTTRTTTWISTNDQGNTETDSGVEIVTTDPSGHLTTTTSKFPRSDSEDKTTTTHQRVGIFS
ncbi:hypothetical protein ACNR9Z_003391 [Candidozyma auris]